MTLTRQIITVTIAFGAVLLVLATLAWACTTTTVITSDHRVLACTTCCDNGACTTYCQ